MALDPEAWSVSANDAIHISLVSPTTGEPTAEFHPEFTYSMFDEHETIFGYQGLKVSLLFAADSMRPCVAMSYDKKVPKIGEVEAEDVMQTLKEYLPEEAFTQSESSFKTSLQSTAEPFTPPGTLHSSFTLHNTVYDVHRSTLSDASTRAFLARLQILIPFFIEGGTPLDLADEPWTLARWDIFLLSTHPTPAAPRAFAGYATLYNSLFFSPTRSDLSRTRLSQFLILPPFQHRGLGSRLYALLTQHYLARAETQELTVEDPSEAFMALRDLQDYARLLRDAEFAGLSIDGVYSAPAKSLEPLRKRHKMPLRQFRRMVEMRLAAALDRKRKDMYRKFRIVVKRRIYAQNADVLAQVDAVERRDKLENTYFGVEDEYVGLLRRFEAGGVEGVLEADGEPRKRKADAVEGAREGIKRIRPFAEEK